MESGITGFHNPGIHSPDDLRCPSCGESAEDLVLNKLLGCSECYATFKQFLKPLRSFLLGDPAGHQGADREWRRLRTMNIQLQEAVLLENFEEAAVIRDQIRKIKAGRSPA